MRDDYQYWNLNKRDGRYGKLLLVDQQDETLFHVFFDDNINRNPEVPAHSVMWFLTLVAGGDRYCGCPEYTDVGAPRESIS